MPLWTNLLTKQQKEVNLASQKRRTAIIGTYTMVIITRTSTGTTVLIIRIRILTTEDTGIGINTG
jgi:hypothetical protein